jgi:hypothetical protein
MYDGENLLDAAVEQLKIAANQLKQQHSAEARMWQKKAQELQGYVDSLTGQIQGLEKANQQIRIALDEKSAEVERLASLNANLTRALQDKDQSIRRYVSLNQSLKGLLNETHEDPTISAPVYDYAEPTSIKREPTPVKREPRAPSTQAPPFTGFTPPQPKPAVNESPQPTASKSSLFIRAAKQELTYSDFNQMISEINQYNRKQQTREDTIANVQRLLCPSHRLLFDQFLPMISGA